MWVPLPCNFGEIYMNSPLKNGSSLCAVGIAYNHAINKFGTI